MRHPCKLRDCVEPQYTVFLVSEKIKAKVKKEADDSDGGEE